MVMGPTHALSGAAVWLAGSAIADAFYDFHQTPAELVVGTIVCAGGSLLPDLDCAGRVLKNRGGSTVARAFGPVTMVMAEATERIAWGFYSITRTKKDGKRNNGHRTLTHTWFFAALIGVLFGWLGWKFGKPAVIPILFFMIGLAMRGLMAEVAREKGWFVVTVVSGVGAFGAARLLPPDGRAYWLIGVAVAAGCVIHTLGDIITKMGCPLFFPLPIKKQVWFEIGVPDKMAVKVGGTVEKKILAPGFTIVAGISAIALLPEVRAAIVALLQ
ncbi:membrane protein [Actinorhabdospora filicis]|uniref:Membrane protein n=1 Tax=Actinorhabdospora filicis TaxID=1785913 RepID=A0A9W6SS57_9ACTN|nr:metal-dependent hydrolase [Actinorhabdospora filicis]GLZ80970.1 membrane protein [Actinorhabdospora filicis]